MSLRHSDERKKSSLSSQTSRAKQLFIETYTDIVPTQGIEPRQYQAFNPLPFVPSNGFRRQVPRHSIYRVGRGVWRSVPARHWFLSLLPRLPGAIGLLYRGLLWPPVKLTRPSRLNCFATGRAVGIPSSRDVL